MKSSRLAESSSGTVVPSRRPEAESMAVRILLRRILLQKRLGNAIGTSGTTRPPRRPPMLRTVHAVTGQSACKIQGEFASEFRNVLGMFWPFGPPKFLQQVYSVERKAQCATNGWFIAEAFGAVWRRNTEERSDQTRHACAFLIDDLLQAAVRSFRSLSSVILYFVGDLSAHRYQRFVSESRSVCYAPS